MLLIYIETILLTGTILTGKDREPMVFVKVLV